MVLKSGVTAGYVPGLDTSPVTKIVRFVVTASGGVSACADPTATTRQSMATIVFIFLANKLLSGFLCSCNVLVMPL